MSRSAENHGGALTKAAYGAHLLTDADEHRLCDLQPVASARDVFLDRRAMKSIDGLDQLGVRDDAVVDRTG